ncbi:T9SS type B sorting domain-containing protein [Pedobacter sp. BS3]|uniref:T9SS type B sorting domain-containing protein n=1 Tax=Pedobacter sp. BS3 TaxID=2567937 RepID=UPI0011EBA4F1|nr:gliding motility-associated C-terminal domain-containing protein [Pedobacter sp. BS3]TZF84861.1 T9SS type B sorting domain-containing protein [Pedobacter sp. BS3]
MKRKLLLLTGLLFAIAVKAQDVVINKVYNSSASSPLGANDVVELLVIKDKTDMRGMYIKDVTSASATSSTFGDAGGKFMFNNSDFWSSLRSGTTIVIRRSPTATDYVEDTDASDYTLDITINNTQYFTAVASSSGSTGTFALGSYDIVVLKAANADGALNGAADGFDYLVHAFLPVLTTNITNAYNALTGPDGTTASSRKMAGNTIVPSNGFLYALNATRSLADFNGTNNLIASSTATPAYGIGEEPDNKAFISYLRNAPVIDSITTSADFGAVTVVYNVYFSKNVTGVDMTDFNLTATGTATGTIASISGSGKLYQVTVTNVDGQGTLRLDKKASGTGITDGVNVILDGFAFTTGEVYTVGKIAPVITAGQSFYITANAEPGITVGVVKATLQGRGSITDWEITGGNEGNNFVIDAQTGTITVAAGATFDYFNKPTYTLSLTVKNGDDLTLVSQSQTITINVLKSIPAPVIYGGSNGQVASLLPLISGETGLLTTLPVYVTLYVDDVPLDTAITIDAQGNWSYKFSTPLTSATHTFYFIASVNGTELSPSGVLTMQTVTPGWEIKPHNILTPNNDGKNDTWVIENLEVYPDNEVHVYDKLGKTVLLEKNYQQNWTGTYNGELLRSGTYYYEIKYGGGLKPIKGSLTILRDK